MGSEDRKKNIMRFDEAKVDQKFFYPNQLDFPLLADMPEANLLIVQSISSWKQVGNSILIHALGRFYHKRYFYRFFDFQPTYDELEDTRSVCIKVEAISDAIIRVQLIQGRALPDRNSVMLSPSKDLMTEQIEIGEDSHSIWLKTSKVDVLMQKESWHMKIQDKEGKILYSQYTSSRGQERPVMKYEQPPFGFLLDPLKGKAYACDQAQINHQESLFGLGEQFLETRRNGQRINLWNTNALGCNSERAYKNIPFMLSTEGYGIFWHTSHAARADIGSSFTKAYGFMTDDPVLDFFFIYGPNLSEILSRYTDLTGKAPVPPDWSFGFWMSKISYKSEDEVLRLAERFREEEIPCDVIHIDTAWFEHDWVCDYTFSPTRFPDPEGMMKKLKEQGFRITLWQLPYLESGQEHTNPVLEEGKRLGYFATRKTGVPDYPNRLVDYSNPEAVHWTKYKLLKPLLEMGVAAFKVDFGESIPPHYHYAGMPSSAMHNLYPLLYNQAVFEITQEIHGEEQGIIWARSAWAGSQRYPVHWAGDPDVDYYGLISTIRSGLSMGLSGFPFWSHDVGGFNAPAIPHVYARWMQVGCFTSHIRAHGHVTREPWDFGDEVRDISRKYLNLRYQLLPYILTQAVDCAKKSLPMFRALVIEYINDRNVWGIDDQYLFGNSFLVAPILSETNERRIYLPKGNWSDYWNGELIQGGQWIHVHAPLDILPLYIRENSIIPMGPIMQYVGEKALSPLTLDCYPTAPGRANYNWVFDGKKVNCLMVVDKNSLVIALRSEIAKVQLKIHHMPVETKAFCNGMMVEGIWKGSDLILSFDSTAEINLAFK